MAPDTNAIHIDGAYAQEIVEFWVHKYHQVKTEFDQLKHTTAQREHQVQKQSDTLQDLIRNLQHENEQRRETDAELRKILVQVQAQAVTPPAVVSAKRESLHENELAERLLRSDTVNEDLTKRLAACEAEKNVLAQQIHVLHAQSSILAAEADTWRREKVAKMFDPVNFVDPKLDSKPLAFTHPQLIISALPPAISEANRLYFLPRPPTCMPLRVPSCGKHGYWFYPAWLLPEDAEFELIVEGRPAEWSYLGRYVSVVLQAGEMKLSEWMTLDEETKMAHCMRVAHQNNNQITSEGEQAQNSGTHPVEIKRRYESGEWSVPCFTLRCVGFNVSLYKTLHTAADSIVDSPTSSSHSAVKRKSQTPEDASKVKKQKVASKKSLHA